jgi:hypothetical protein
LFAVANYDPFDPIRDAYEKHGFWGAAAMVAVFIVVIGAARALQLASARPRATVPPQQPSVTVKHTQVSAAPVAKPNLPSPVPLASQFPFKQAASLVAAMKPLLSQMWRPFVAAYIVAIGWLSLSGRLISSSDELELGRVFLGAPLFALGVAYFFQLAKGQAQAKKDRR